MPIRHRTYSPGENGALFGALPEGTIESVTLVLNGVFFFAPDGITSIGMPTTGVVRMGAVDIGKATFTSLTGSSTAYSDPIDSKQRLGANASGLAQ